MAFYISNILQTSILQQCVFVCGYRTSSLSPPIFHDRWCPCYKLLDWRALRVIFVWPWNENVQTKQKQQTNVNGAIWFGYRTDTNTRGLWLVKRTLGCKNFLPENFLEINRYFSFMPYCNMIGQSNNAFSVLRFSLAGKRRVYVLIFSSIGW